jgi:hypothetical protein
MSGAVKMSHCLGTDIRFMLTALTTPNPVVRQELTQSLGCMSSAKSCEDVFECAGLLVDESCNSSFDDICAGEKLMSCVKLGPTASASQWGLVREVDCADDSHGNNECSINTYGDYDYGGDGYGSCNTGKCEGNFTTCEGDVLISCNNNLKQRVECSKYGMACIDGPYGASCTQKDADSSCDGDYCDGSTLVTCNYGYPSFSVNCSSFHPDFKCVQTGGYYSDAECSVTTPAQVCEGSAYECINETTLGVCIGGVWVTGDCGMFQDGVCQFSEYGGIVCQEPSGGSDGEGSPMWDAPAGDVSYSDWVYPDWGPAPDTSADAIAGDCDTEYQFACFGGDCILKSWVCDGMDDCEFAEDEYGCPEPTHEADGY